MPELLGGGLFNKLCQVKFERLSETDAGAAGEQPAKGYLNRLECKERAAVKSSTFFMDTFWSCMPFKTHVV